MKIKHNYYHILIISYNSSKGKNLKYQIMDIKPEPKKNKWPIFLRRPQIILVYKELVKHFNFWRINVMMLKFSRLLRKRRLRCLMRNTLIHCLCNYRPCQMETLNHKQIPLHKTKSRVP